MKVYMHRIVRQQIHMYPVEIVNKIYVRAKSAITARSFWVLLKKDKQLSMVQQCVCLSNTLKNMAFFLHC